MTFLESTTLWLKAVGCVSQDLMINRVGFEGLLNNFTNMNLKHFYNIVDETTGEMIYSGWAYSQESLLEGDFRKAEYAIQLHEGRMKAQAELDAIGDRLENDNEISQEKVANEESHE